LAAINFGVHQIWTSSMLWIGCIVRECCTDSIGVSGDAVADEMIDMV